MISRGITKGITNGFSKDPGVLACLALAISMLFMASTVQSAEQLYTEQPSITPELANAGIMAVGVQTLTINHEQQLSSLDFSSLADRLLKVEIWYPAKVATGTKPTTYENATRLGKAFSLQAASYRDAPAVTEGKYPLVVISHGYTGYRTIMFYLAEHLASHGYVVVGIDHTDSTTSEVDFNQAPFAGFPSTLLNRARDQQFVLDYFSHGESWVGNIIDTDNAAIVGYSMGGYGALNTVGGCYAFDRAGLQRLGFGAQQLDKLLPLFNSCNAGRDSVDRRWKAMIAFAPWGGEQNVHDAKAMDNIMVPSLFVAGDQDDVSGYELGVKKLFEQTGAKQKYLLVYQNARHNIAPHPAPKIAYSTDADLGHYAEPSWSSEQLNRINKHMSLAFLDCHIKHNAKHCAYLPKRLESTQVKDENGKLTAPWPGFVDRWGTGVLFYRGN